MNSFENHHLREMRYQEERARARREEHNRRQWEKECRVDAQNLILVLILAILTVAVSILILKRDTQEPVHEPASLENVHLAVEVAHVEEPPVIQTLAATEVEATEYAAIDPTIWRDVAMDYGLQVSLHEICEESGVDYDLALAVIWRESTFRNIIGDDGASIGYMQIQPRWHQGRMEELGVTDLMDPVSNFRVGCDYLAELLAKYPTVEALTCYNTGKPGHNQYADDVLGYYEELKSHA